MVESLTLHIAHRDTGHSSASQQCHAQAVCPANSSGARCGRPARLRGAMSQLDDFCSVAGRTDRAGTRGLLAVLWQCNGHIASRMHA
ncbi:hypothetical protein MRB53_038014 [Persea americana]|nr:hypothetical protein MRB53_038014 [Persea americana]